MKTLISDTSTRSLVLPQAYCTLARQDWTCFLLPYGTPPIPEERREPLVAYVETIASYLSSTTPLHSGVWLQVQAFPTDDTPQLPARYGRTWRPTMGLGVWPDREAPRTWRPADFTDRDWGTPLPPLMDSVLFLAGDESATSHAWRMLFGSGCTLFALIEKQPSAFHARVRDELAGSIQDPALQHKAFYVPLLDTTSVSALKGRLSDVLPGVHLYLRESKAENGFVMLVPTCSIAGLVAAGLLLKEFLPGANSNTT